MPGGQAQYLRVPQAHFGPIKVPHGTPDEQFLFLSDVVPTAWQAVQYADVQEGGTLAVLGLGPIGQLAARIGRLLGAGRVIRVDAVPERLAMATSHQSSSPTSSTRRLSSRLPSRRSSGHRRGRPRPVLG